MAIPLHCIAGYLAQRIVAMKSEKRGPQPICETCKYGRLTLLESIPTGMFSLKDIIEGNIPEDIVTDINTYDCELHDDWGCSVGVACDGYERKE